MKNKILSIFLALIFIITLLPTNVVFAETIASGDCSRNQDGTITWTLDSNGTLTISGSGDIYVGDIPFTIPQHIEGPWEKYRESITNIVINSGITEIGAFSFSKCENVQTISISDTVTTIGAFAFLDCKALLSVTLSKNIDVIASYNPFAGCDSLTQIRVNNQNVKYKTSNGILYDKSGEKLLAFPNMASYSDAIFNGVTSIGGAAFRQNTTIKNIVLPESITKIDDFAFYKCEYLKNIQLNEGLNIVGPNKDYVFSYCSSIESINIPSTLMKIPDLWGCTSLKEITYSGEPQDMGRFGGCISLTEISFPDSMKYLSQNAFEGCVNLKKVKLSKGMISNITMFSFYNCEALESIIIPEGVKAIDQYAFSGASNLKSITIPKSLTTIKAMAFNNCNNLETIYYMGTSDEWDNIIIESDGNDDVFYADVEMCTLVESVSIEPKELSMTVGEQKSINATVLPKDATNKSVFWESSDENIVVVDNGDLRAKGIGSATITVTTEEGEYTDTCEVTVLPVNVTGIDIDKLEINITEGQTATITATVLPENATDKTIIWSSVNEDIATVENGIVTGKTVGSTVVLAKSNDGGFSKYCVVTVSKKYIPVAEIIMNVSTMSLIEGYGDVLTATVKPDNATNKNVVWTSNNASVATVEKGTVTAVSPGTAVIIATTEDGGHIATCIVTVSGVDQEVVLAPIASVLSGMVKEKTNVLLLTVTPNAEIYYTLDGTVPTRESNKYTVPITILSDTKLKAIAVKKGMQDSNVSTFNYILADSTMPYVNVVTNVTGKKGDITTVSVNTTKNSKMAGGSFNLVYDNTAVELVSVKSGNIVSAANPIINDAYAENKIRVIWAGTREINAGGEIISAQFKILDTDKDVTYFNLEKVKMADGDSNKVSLQSGDGILTIGEAIASTLREYYTESTINSNNSVSVNVFANSEQNGVLIVAEYDKQGRLIQFENVYITNTDNTYTVNMDKEISAGSKIKVFVWSSLGGARPLSAVEEK